MDLEEENRRLQEELARRQQELQALRDHFTDVIREHVARREALAQRNRELSLAIAIAQALSRDPRQVLELAVERVTEGLEVEGVALHLLEGGELVLAAHRGLTQELEADLARRVMGEGTIGKVAQSGHPWLTSDMAQDPRPSYAPKKRAGFASFIVVPLMKEDQAVGVLSVFARPPRKLTPQEMLLLSAIASALVPVLENARLQQELQDKVQRLTLVTDLVAIINSSLHIQEVYEAFVRKLREIVPVDRAGIAFIEGDRLRYVAVFSLVESPFKEGETVPLEGTGTAWVKEHRQLHYEPDILQEAQLWIDRELAKVGIRSVIRLPLFHQGQVFGTLHLNSTRPHAYGPREQAILTEVAAHISPAIVTHRLYQELKAQEAELERANWRLQELLPRLT